MPAASYYSQQAWFKLIEKNFYSQAWSQQVWWNLKTNLHLARKIHDLHRLCMWLFLAVLLSWGLRTHSLPLYRRANKEFYIKLVKEELFACTYLNKILLFVFHNSRMNELMTRSRMTEFIRRPNCLTLRIEPWASIVKALALTIASLIQSSPLWFNPRHCRTNYQRSCIKLVKYTKIQKYTKIYWNVLKIFNQFWGCLSDGH